MKKSSTNKKIEKDTNLSIPAVHNLYASEIFESQDLLSLLVSHEMQSTELKLCSRPER